MKIAGYILVLLSFSSVAFASDQDPRNAPSHYVTAFFGKSEMILGSEDGRFGGGISFAYGQPEPRFKYGSVVAQVVYEGYIDHTQSDGGSGFGPNATFAGGALAYGRWRWPLDKQGNGVYADLGAGVQLASETTLDLESTFNTTPVADLGGTFKDGHVEYFIGLRFLHISNAGTVKPNYGQNELFLTLGFRY